MNRLQSNSLRSNIASNCLSAARLAAIAGVLIGISGCSSDSKTPNNAPAQPAAGTQTDAGDLSDGGEFGACSNKPPASPSPDLNGRWAWLTTGSLFVPATGLTSAFYTRTISVLLADVAQASSDLSINAQYCDHYEKEDGTAAAQVTIPDRFRASLRPFTRTGSYADNGAGTAVFFLPSFVEVIGATLADPANDPLPTDASDTRVVDQDQDGNPGVTIKLGGSVSGDLYVVQRQKSELTGIAVSPNRLEGHYGFTSEQNVLDSNPAYLKPLAAQTAVADPNLCASTFTMVRVQASTTCADVPADTTIFD